MSRVPHDQADVFVSVLFVGIRFEKCVSFCVSPLTRGMGVVGKSLAAIYSIDSMIASQELCLIGDNFSNSFASAQFACLFVCRLLTTIRE